jgi:hypothetical protein
MLILSEVNAECHNKVDCALRCYNLSVIMLRVIILIVILLNGVRLSFILAFVNCRTADRRGANSPSHPI